MASARPATVKSAIGALGFVGAKAVAGGIEMLLFPQGNVFVKAEWLERPGLRLPTPRPDPRRRTRGRLARHHMRPRLPARVALAHAAGTAHRPPLVLDRDRPDRGRGRGLAHRRSRAHTRTIGDRSRLRRAGRWPDRDVPIAFLPPRTRPDHAVRAVLTWGSATVPMVLRIGFLGLLLTEPDEIVSAGLGAIPTSSRPRRHLGPLPSNPHRPEDLDLSVDTGPPRRHHRDRHVDVASVASLRRRLARA